MKWQPTQKPRRLMSPWVWVGLVIAFLLSVIWVIPRASMFQQLAHHDTDEKIDSVRVILLQALLQKGIRGFSLHREYIRQLALTKNFPAAFAELDNLNSKWESANRDSLWMLELELACLAFPTDAKNMAKTRIASAVENLLIHGGIPALTWAQGRLPLLGYHLQTAQIQLRLATLDSIPKTWQRRAAKSYTLAGECESAAKWLMVLYDQSLAPKEQRSFFLQTLKILQACDKQDKALEVAKHRIQDWRDDTDILLEVIALARSANQTKVAEQFAQMLVSPLASAPEP